MLDDALCVRTWDWSETSQTVSIFTRGHGVIRALAKGARRPRGAHSGGIELLSRAQAAFIVKRHTDLALLTAWDLVETFPALRRSLAAHNAGLYIADLVQHFVTDHDPHPALFDATIEALRALGEPAGPGAALLRFQWSLLAEAGYRPSIDAEEAGTAAESARRTDALRFSPERGGLVSAGEGAPESHRAWPVRRETIDLLRRIASEPAAAGAAPAPVIERANRLLAAYARHVLGREPPTLATVFGTDLPR